MSKEIRSEVTVLGYSDKSMVKTQNLVATGLGLIIHLVDFLKINSCMKDEVFLVRYSTI